MGERKSVSARRKSKRVAQAAASHKETQQTTSPVPEPDSSSHYDLSGTADFSGERDFSFAPEDDAGNSSDSELVAPVLPAKRKAEPKNKGTTTQSKKAAVSEATLSSDSEAEPPAKRARSKGQKPTATVNVREHKVVLSIPRATETGNQRSTFTHATQFSEILHSIHETVGCGNVARKPDIAYKLSSATKNSASTSLALETDWQGCLEDVRQAENAKKPGTIIPVLIEISAQYLTSLAKHKGKSSASGTGKTICKITAAGTHHHLSNNQQRAWAQALLSGKHGVTLKTPPRDIAGQNLFGMFFKSVIKDPPQAALFGGMQLPFGNMPPHMQQANPYMMPYPYMPYGMPPLPPMEPTHIPQARTPAASRSSHASMSALPSSDPPDMGALNPYPEIPDFLRELDGYQPRRNLLDYILTFDQLDFYNIDGIANLGSAESLVELTKITLGNAKYIMAQVKDEMRRVDRYRKSLA